MNYLLETRNLKFNNINYPDINIEKGSINFITGESGCGKSTLLKIFNQTCSQSDGIVLFNGEDNSKIDSISLREKITLVSQNIFLFNSSIKQNFIDFYRMRGLNQPDDTEIQRYLDILRVPFDLNYDCTTMSGGEKQRVYIAIFLSLDYDILMLDEPTSALDSENSYLIIKNIWDYLKSKTKTLIIVTHDKTLTENFETNLINLGKEGH